MFLQSFQTVSQSVLQLVILGLVGFLAFRRNVICVAGLRCLNDLVIGVLLPCFMFSEIVKRFDPALFPNWWTLPLWSVAVSLAGFLFGLLALGLGKSLRIHENEFLGLTTFQNSGYLPLPLVASLMAPAEAEQMFIMIFLFLLGFNMTIFSFGVMLLTGLRKTRFDARKIFNAPVIATLAALVCVFLKIQNAIPPVLLKPTELLGRCAIPLSILVVGGNLAALKRNGVNYARPMTAALAIKLVALPLFFLGLVVFFKLPSALGFLLVLQAAMPPAALLSVIIRNQSLEDNFTSTGLFYGHVASIATIPLFLGLLAALAGK